MRIKSIEEGMGWRMKAATVYERSNALYLHASSKTTAGVWIATPPFTKVDTDTTTLAKGEAILQVIKASQEGVPHPTNWNGLIDPLLALADVKSWATFMKNAAGVAMESDGERLKLIPNRNLGPKDGFEPVLAGAVDVSCQAAPDAIGSALEKLLT
jgi:hypothetical protein